MADFYSLREAMFLTEFPVAQQVYASSWEADNLAEMLRFMPITDGSATKTYSRRKTGDKISADWVVPGQVITSAKDPKLVEVVARLRPMVKQPKVPSHLRQNYNNGTLGRDPLLTKTFQILKDCARDIWKTAITGIYVDVASIVGGGGLTTALLANGTKISPGPYNDPQRGQGVLVFVKARNALSYKCPGDNDYGDEVVITAAATVTLRSGHVAGYITMTIGTVPASDAQCLIEFTSTNQQPDGLVNLIDPSQIIPNNQPRAIDFRILDQLRTRLMPAYRDSVMTAWVMHTDQFNALKDRARAFGGARLEDMVWGNDEMGLPEFMGMAERKVPSYDGHPILVNERIPDVVLGNAPSTHDVFCVCLDPAVMEDTETDFGAFTGIVRGAPDGSVMKDSFGLGFFLQDLGPLQNETNDAMRLTYEGAWMLGSSGAASKMSGIWDPF